jgi:lipid-A-disaccharide synthase-like uncharacterized protein
MDLFQLVGWLGVLLFIVAYLLLSVEILSADKLLYHFLNMLGGIALVINAVHISDHPTIVVNAVWGIIAFGAMIKIGRTKNIT